MSVHLEKLLKILEDTKTVYYCASIKDYPENVDIHDLCKTIQAFCEEEGFETFLMSNCYCRAMDAVRTLMVYDIEDLPNYDELLVNPIYQVCKFVLDWTLADEDTDPDCPVDNETYEDLREKLYKLPAEYVLLADLQISKRKDGLGAVYDNKPDLVELIQNAQFPEEGKELVAMLGVDSYIKALRMLNVLRKGEKISEPQAELPSFN